MNKILNFKSLLLIAIITFSSLCISAGTPTKSEFKESYAQYQGFADQEQWADSLPHAKKSYEIGKVVFDGTNKNNAGLAYNYGLNLFQLRKFKEAEKILNEAAQLYKNLYGEDSDELISVYMDLGHSIAKPTSGSKQKNYYQQALNLTAKNYGEDSVQYGQLIIEVGVNLYSKDAKPYLYKGHEVLKNKLGPNAPRVAHAAYQIGKLEYNLGNKSKAIAALNESLETFSIPDQPSNKIELLTHGLLVKAYEGLGQRDEATRHCLAIGRMTPRTPDQDYQPLAKYAPQYPVFALNAGKQGSVTLEYDVDESGFVQNITVAELDGSNSFVKASKDAASKFRYAPGFEDGVPVVTKGVTNRFTFTLSN